MSFMLPWLITYIRCQLNTSDNGTTTYCYAPEIENGYLDPQVSAIEEGQYYIVHCDSGYTVDGLNTVVCQNDGSLSSSATCTG